MRPARRRQRKVGRYDEAKLHLIAGKFPRLDLIGEIKVIGLVLHHLGLVAEARQPGKEQLGAGALRAVRDRRRANRDGLESGAIVNLDDFIALALEADLLAAVDFDQIVRCGVAVTVLLDDEVGRPLRFAGLELLAVNFEVDDVVAPGWLRA